MAKELNELVFCSGCADKDPPFINKSVYIIPARVRPYDLSPDGFTIDRQVMGVCEGCLSVKSKFQIGGRLDVGANYPHLIYKKVQ